MSDQRKRPALSPETWHCPALITTQATVSKLRVVMRQEAHDLLNRLQLESKGAGSWRFQAIPALSYAGPEKLTGAGLLRWLSRKRCVLLALRI